MVLAGKLSTELGIKAPGAKFFNILSSQLHQVQNICERVHVAKLHEGEDWHHSDSVKHWTYVIGNYFSIFLIYMFLLYLVIFGVIRKDGKVHTCNETLEEIDEENKKITINLFGGDIDQHYKVFKVYIEVIDEVEGSVVVKWTFEYEKTSEDIDPPNGYIDYISKTTKILMIIFSRRQR